MRISDWSSDVCSSDLPVPLPEDVVQREADRGEDIAAMRLWRSPRQAVTEAPLLQLTGAEILDHHIALHHQSANDVSPFLRFHVDDDHTQTGRASRRERVCQYV